MTMQTAVSDTVINKIVSKHAVAVLLSIDKQLTEAEKERVWIDYHRMAEERNISYPLVINAVNELLAGGIINRTKNGLSINENMIFRIKIA